VYITPRTYSGYATLDRALTYNATDVKLEFDKIVPDHGTPMRDAIYKSILNLTQSGRPKAVKAVVILSDGDYNWYGDPLAHNAGNGHTSWDPTSYGDLDSDWHFYSDLNATNQNMTLYAKNNGIKIYSIAFAGERSTLRTLAEGSGGKYYPATAANIADVYTAIAGDLKTEAGVNTQADLDYGTVNINQAPTSGVFTYTYRSGVSTMNKTTWKDGTLISGPHYYNQNADWVDNNLSFNVGTIKLNQVWMATYMLKVNKPGNIDVFGVGSHISFNNNASQLFLPKTLITALPDMNTTGSVNVTKTLTITDLNVTLAENETIAYLTVDIQILPSSPGMSVIADIYITDEDQHTTTWIKSVEINPVVNGRMNVTSIDLTQFQLGKKYTFYVDFINKQPGTNPIYWAQLKTGDFVRLAKATGKYIRLE